MRRSLIPVTAVLLALFTVGGCGSEEPTAGPGASVSAPTSSESDSGETFPADVASPEQGGEYVAVVLATGGVEEIDASVASVAKYGYTAGVSDVGCLSGAAEALDLPDDAMVSSLLFADEAAASAFADAYVTFEDGLMVGRTPVTAFCLD